MLATPRYSVYDYSGSIGSLYYSANDYITNPIIPTATGSTHSSVQLQGTTNVNPGKPALSTSGFALPLLQPGLCPTGAALELVKGGLSGAGNYSANPRPWALSDGGILSGRSSTESVAAQRFAFWFVS